MVYRGCIMKIEEEFAVVLTDHMEYLKIIKKDGLVVGKKIIFVKEDIYKERRATIKNIGLIAAVFIAMIVSITGIGRLNVLENMSAAAVVSVDINPSIEFEINEENKVLNVVSLNTDGEKLMDREFTGMPIEEALFVVINNAKQKHYITKEKNTVLIGTVAVKADFKEKTDQIKNNIEQKIEENEKLKELNLIYVQGNTKDLKEAKKQKISIGKYEVYKQSKEEKQKITLEQIKHMKVQELVDKEIGKLKEKTKEKEKIEKGIEKEKKHNMEGNEKNSLKDKGNKTKKVKQQQEAKKEEKKKNIDLENKNENIKEIKKEAIEMKNEVRIENIENKQEEKKEKIAFNEENKKEILENKKDIQKEKIETIKEDKKEQKQQELESKKIHNEEKKKEVIPFHKENKKEEKQHNKEDDNLKPDKQGHKKNKKD